MGRGNAKSSKRRKMDPKWAFIVEGLKTDDPTDVELHSICTHCIDIQEQYYCTNWIIKCSVLVENLQQAINTLCYICLCFKY